jgi:hypothetical protein
MSPILRPITGTWTLPNGGNAGRSVLTLTLTSPDYVTATVFVPDVVRVTVDEDGDVVPVAGYQGLTVEVDGKDRAVIWASEEGSVQATYRAALEGAQARDDLGEYLIPDVDEPITLQEILELGVPSSSPQYLTIQTYISEIFKGPWDENTVYQSGDQVRRGESIYVARGEIAAGVDPVEGLPWELFFSSSALPGGGSFPTAHKTTHAIGGTDVLTPADIGAYAASNPSNFVDAAGAANAAPVQSVNTKTGTVTLNAADVGADASGSASAVQGNLDTHTGSSTNVHGIANTADLVVTGDARLSDARTPTAHKASHQTGGSDALAPADIGAEVAGAASAVQGNLDAHTGASTSVHGIANTADLVLTGDARLSDARTPTAHKSTHAIGGTDVLSLSDIGAYAASNPSNFVDATGAAAAAPVQSVAGKTGAVTLAKADVGLGNVDNTTDLNKPISTATQTALDAKVSSDPTGITGADQITNMVSLTQAEYDAIGTKSATTFYVIAG